MVDILYVLLGAIVAYTVVGMALRARGLLPRNVRITGPITTIRTQRGKEFLDWLAQPKRLWRAWGNFGVGIALVVMFGTFLAVLFTGLTVVEDIMSGTVERTAVTEPQNVLVIPGVNEFLPLSVAPEIVLGLLVGLVVHEGGHGLLCRVGDIDIKSMGVAGLAFVPIGAFVEPDDRSRSRADRGAQTRMFAAGVTNNFAVAFVAFALLFGPVVGAIAIAPGAPVGDVVDGTAASGVLGSGDRIVAVDGVSVDSAAELDTTLADITEREVTLTVVGPDGERSDRTVERSLVVTAAVPSFTSALDTSDEGITRIESVAGEPVATEAGLVETLRANPVATVETNRGTTEIVGGVFSLASPDGALAEAGAPVGETEPVPLYITRFAGERVVTTEEFSAVRAETSPGDTVTVEAYVETESGFERRSYEVTLGADPNSEAGLVGIVVQPGVAGISVDDLGVTPYPAEQFLGAVGGDSGGFLQSIAFSLFLPFAGAVGFAQFNFAGFVGPWTNFFTAPAGTFVVANVLFWIGWININLAFFNCIPAYPLDGGHILRTSTEAVVSRLPVSSGRQLTSTVTTSITLLMLVGVFLMVFGPQLFG